MTRAMQSKKLIGSVAALAALTGAGVASPTLAWGDTATTLQAVKDAAHTAITARVTALNRAASAIAQTPSMGSDQAVETAVVTGDISGLQQLDATIQSDTTVAAARADAAKITRDFRVYALVLPVAHMVRAADLIDNLAVPKLTAAEQSLQAAVTRRGAANLQASLDDMKAQIAAAQSATAGLQARLEGFTPAQWNSNHALLSPARTSLEAARSDLRKAREDAKTVVAGLAHH